MTAKESARAMTVVCGDQCSARCTGCFTESSPDAKNWISDESIAQLAEWIEEHGPPKHFAVTGGEPGLRPAVLARLMAAAGDAKKRVVTNGSWGASRQLTRQVIQVLTAGVERVQVSMGDEHKRWVQLAAVAKALEAIIKETPCRIELPIELVRGEVGDDVLEVASRAVALAPERVQVISTAWAAQDADGHYRYEEPLESGDGPFCDQLTSARLVVDWDGAVYRCCGTQLRRAWRRESPYFLGTLADGFAVPGSSEDGHAAFFSELGALKDGAVPSWLGEQPSAEWNRMHRCTQCHLACSGLGSQHVKKHMVVLT